MAVRNLTAAGLGACIALFSAAALAQSPTSGDGAATRTLRYSTQELATPAGTARVATRIRDAADAVCGGDSLLQRLTPGFERCRREVRDRALAQLNLR
jgi:UrcA family protein